MSDLHPRARALIDAAKRGEPSLSSEAQARVRQSVLRRAVALGTAVTTTSAAAKLIVALTSPFGVLAMITAVAATALLGVDLRALPPAHPVPELLSEPPSRPALDRVTAPERTSPSAPLPPRIGESQMPAPPVASQSLQVLPVAPPALPPPALARRNAALGSGPAQSARLSATPTQLPATTASVAAPPAESPSPLNHETAPATPSDIALSGGAGGPMLNPARLAADLALLRQTHAALQAGHAANALSLLDHAGGPLETGPLAEEAQVARISALCQLGRTADAHTAIDHLLAAWPGSPAGNRLRGGCGAPSTAMPSTVTSSTPRKPSDD